MKVYDFAIEMEIEGERYYQAQAEQHQADPLGVVFSQLAKAEARHADLLRGRANAIVSDLTDDTLAANSEQIFKNLQDYKPETWAQPSQLDAYRMALELEQRSIDLYESMLADAVEPADRNLLTWLIGQEKRHRALVAELVTLLGRPVEWVEDAEFGPREEY